jgi:NADH-quinone oxidoreductase subunit L
LFAEVATEEHHFGTQDILMAIAVIGGLVGIGIAFSKYIKQNQVPAADAEINGFAKVLYNKYYVDEAYDTIFVKTTNGLSRFFRDHVETTLSSLVFDSEK